MKRTTLILAAAAGMIATMPAMAQRHKDTARSESRRETVPLQVRDEQVADMQQKLNDQGFSAGQVDGFWGPNTSAALKRYQAKNSLRQTGQLDPSTLAALGIASAAAAAPATLAQATTAPAQTIPIPPPSAPVVTTSPGTPIPAVPGVNTSTGTVPGAGLVNRNTGVAAAAGNSNQAVATTAANAPQPAKGANSFSRGEVQRRIEREGYTAVADLVKDGDGIWRGHGTKAGASVGVWLDYKGNVGQQ